MTHNEFIEAIDDMTPQEIPAHFEALMALALSIAENENEGQENV